MRVGLKQIRMENKCDVHKKYFFNLRNPAFVIRVSVIQSDSELAARSEAQPLKETVHLRKIRIF